MGWDEAVPDQVPAEAVANKPKVSKRQASDVTYNDEQIKKWLFGRSEKSSSNVCAGIYGYDGTAKSGIALDCRTDEEKSKHMKLIVFDLDGGCGPLRAIYHDNDPDIIIVNPMVRDEQKNVDYEETLIKLRSALDYIERNLDDLNVKAIIFDGLDKFLKVCEYCMREDINKDVTDGFNRIYWKLRNQKYGDVLEQIKSLDVARFFITHLKKDEKSDTVVPDWEKKTGDMLFQRVRCFRETKVENGDKVIYLKAEIEKSKTNLALEGKIYTISETRHSTDGKVTAKWHGMRFLPDNTIWQRSTEKAK